MEVLKLHLNGYKVDTTFKGAWFRQILFFYRCLLCLYEIYSSFTLLFPTQKVDTRGLKYCCLFLFLGGWWEKVPVAVKQSTYIDLMLYCHQNRQSCPIQYLLPSVLRIVLPSGNWLPAVAENWSFFLFFFFLQDWFGANIVVVRVTCIMKLWNSCNSEGSGNPSAGRQRESRTTLLPQCSYHVQFKLSWKCTSSQALWREYSLRVFGTVIVQQPPSLR